MFSDKEKKARSSAIAKLLDLIDEGDAEDVKGLKPIAQMSVTKVEPLDHEEPDADDMGGKADCDDDDEDEGKLGLLRRALGREVKHDAIHNR